MTPCNNCHGGEGTRPTRSELQWLRGDDLPVAPTMDCPAEAHWPEALRQARPELQGYPWWTRGNFRATQHRMQPSTPTYSFDLESGSVSLDLGLRSFVYNLSNHRTTFNSWSTYTVDVHADPNAGLALNLEVEHNRLSLDNGLIALSGVSIDGPYFFNFSDIPRQGIFDPAGNFCLLPSTLLAYPSEGFSAHPRSHLSVGINILRPDLLNIGGGGGISANLCFPMPGEFREPRISSEAPLPSGYELHDLADRVQSWRANRPQNPVPSSDSVWNHLYLSSGRRLQNVFELLRVGSEAQVNLRDLQDLFIPGLIDLGPSQANLQVRWTAEGELEASLRSLVLAFQEMGYGTAAGTETPGFLLQSARVTGPESESALNLRFDPIARQLRSLRGHLDLEAAFSLLRLGLRNLQIQGHADIARTAEGNFAFSLSNFNFLIPRNTLPTSDPNAIPLSLEGSLRGAEGPHELLGVSIPGGLRGEWNPLRNEVHLEGNLVLRGEIDGPRGHYEARVPLTFFTTLRMGPEGARPVPGSTAMEIHDLEIVHAETRREVLREGEVFLSDDPEREIFRPNPDFHRFRIGTEEFGGPPTSPVSVEIRGIWANHHRVSLRGEIPLALESGPSPSYDFSRLLQDGSEFHVDMEDLQPVLRPPETSPHFNVIGGHLRVQRFPQADGSWLWDIMLGGDAMTLGEGRKGLSLRNPELALEFDRLSPTDEGTRVRIPLLDFRANAQGADSGMLRGPVQLHLNPHQAGLEMVLDPHYRPTEIQDLDLNLSLQGIDVLPPRLRRNLDNGGRFIGIDGRLQGHFEMNYPEDRRLWNGHGEIRLRGDRQGDIYLVNSAFHRTGAPLVRNTRWRWERIDRIDWGRGYAIGDFHLQTLLNPTSLLRPLEGSEQGLRAYGGDGQVLLPGEVWAEMPYDNQPWSPRGFRNRIVDYIETLCRQDPRCGL